VIGDATRLHQVSMNLCTNAVKAMPNGGTLRVRLERSVVAEPVAVTRGGLSRGPYALLTVSDTGVGMAPALLERVFEPFFTTKGIGEGTGLGLSLVDGIVQDLGGAIAVTSRPGEGSTFALWLPVTGETARPVTGSAPELPPGRGETVMVVDDEPMLVSLAEEMLAGLGYEPVGFGSAVAALEAFRLAPGRFDALLTDENMPGLGGIALACELRAIQPGLAVVLMSGYGGARLGERAAAAGLSEVLRKPLQRRDLSQALAAVLHAREPASFPNTLSP
jgi:CheY-like chemotaxis protein